MTLFKLYSSLTTLSADQSSRRAALPAPSATQALAVLPSSAPYGSPRTLPALDPVSTIDELSVAT